MIYLNYLGSGMICIFIYFIISSLIVSKGETINVTLGRTLMLAILFLILTRT